MITISWIKKWLKSSQIEQIINDIEFDNVLPQQQILKVFPVAHLS